MQTMDGWEWRTGDFLWRNVIATENRPTLKRTFPGWAEWREVGDGAMIAATEHGLQGATKVVQYCCLLRSFFSWNVCSCRLLHLIWTGVWLGQLLEKCSPKISTIGSFSSQKYQADSNSWTRTDIRWQLSFILIYIEEFSDIWIFLTLRCSSNKFLAGGDHFKPVWHPARKDVCARLEVESYSNQRKIGNTSTGCASYLHTPVLNLRVLGVLFHHGWGILP